MKPSRVVITSYQVGFGDCFLLSFEYPNEQRHVLMDFGSTGLPDGVPKNQLELIANNIAERTKDQRLAVVATHRHKDHISGFATKKQRPSSGKTIADLKPELVLQPWTEDPKLAVNAKGPLPPGVSLSAHHVSSLAAMQRVAGAIFSEVKRVRYLSPSLRQELSFMGENNLANLDAVENLMTMSAIREYAKAGDKTALEDLLPGIKIDILGPPSIEQSEKITKQRSRDQDEFWHLMANAASSLGPTKVQRVAPLFPDFTVDPTAGRFPIDARWIISQAKRLRADQMLRLVRILDNVLNNTSLILLFRCGSKSLLFPGDAQIENWSFALGQPAVREKLKKVDLYKVGHHGSLNATPKSLWDLFDRKSAEENPDRLQTLMSTMAHKHGDEERRTEVPRQTLVQALDRQSALFTTQSLNENELFHETSLDLS
ncbi:hypothetical protein [Mesorhizobium kowhaii]|uniref:Metallo-beta-lactamase domain-containing protein n=1 Tax=Mesorhizobium kowhaii TaxID=1300272 RepID=A0A2W7C6P1_9HYPH|nr:hypothetical protein [Mesorhizobium kowhaii]PZV38835.1 hypothetical protein B5V02_09295 [Mesorhizobium kowhaii]